MVVHIAMARVSRTTARVKSKASSSATQAADAAAKNASSAAKSSATAAKSTAAAGDDVIVGFMSALRGARRELFDGALGRTLAVLALYPVDALKTPVQVSSGQSYGAVAAAARHGITAAPRPFPPGAAAVFRGAAVALLGQLPYGILTYGAFEVARSEMDRRFADQQPARVRVVVSACIADLFGALWLAPTERIKLQLQTGMYETVLSAVSGTWQSGGIPGFFHGLPELILRDLPFRALQLVAYDAAKKLYVERIKKRGGGSTVNTENINFSCIDTVVVGASVGALVGVVTTPLDLIKTRVMSQRIGAGANYDHWLSCLTRIAKRDGIYGLFRGVGPRAFYMATSVALFSLGYEASKKFMADKKLLWHADVATVASASRPKTSSAALCGRRRPQSC